MEKQMKTQSRGNRNSILRSLLVGLLVINSFGVLQAQEKPASDTLNAQIKYVGILGNHLIFQIDCENPADKNFTVVIEDQAGYQFYNAMFKDKRFTKKYAIDKFELENNSISFTILSQGKMQKQVFDINRSKQIVEELSVVKL